jgi:signal transduction histidine kinase
MNRRFLRWMTIVLPVGFIGVILAISEIFFLEGLTSAEVIFTLILVSVGALLFSNWVFDLISQREDEIQRGANQLEALNKAALSLITELDLGVVLQKVVDLSCELVTSRYGALGVISEDGDGFEQFITSGISSEERRAIGSNPEGKGLLGLLIKEGESILLNNIIDHESHAGFPETHPFMQSLLGVPIKTKGKVIGNLYLAEKIDPQKKTDNCCLPFTVEDQKVLEMFATQAAIAIENAKLYRQIQQLAILEERQRFGMDLHDGVIQSIYAVGLMLEDIQRRMDEDLISSKEGISTAIRSLNTAISDIRNYILDLRPQHFQGRNILQGIEELARALRANTFMNVHVEIRNVDPRLLNPERTVEILHIAQEALSNVQKHAHASHVDIILSIVDQELSLVIIDNGISITPETLKRPIGNGLLNMRERTAALSGGIDISPGVEGGTEVALTVPLQINTSSEFQSSREKNR